MATTTAAATSHDTWACPAGFDREELRRRVHATYEAVATHPDAGFHFHVGIDYAVQSLGYDRAALQALPPRCTARFAGVGHPLALHALQPGETVLDHACGAGTDLLLAAQAIGAQGRAIGVDLSPAMCAQAALAADEAGLSARVDIRPGDFAALPVMDASVDTVISNGVLNLAPDKHAVMAEIARVLRPGGRLLLADVVVERPLAPVARRDPALWAACVAGALSEEDLLALTAAVGLGQARTVARYDCFRGTPVERRFGRALPVHAVGVVAVRPPTRARNAHGTPRPAGPSI